MLLWTFVYQFNFLWTYVYSPLGYLPSSGIAGSYGMVTQCLVFWGTARLFSITAASFYILTSCVWGFRFFYIANICYYLFYSLYHLVFPWNIHRDKTLEANSSFVDVFCVLGVFFWLLQIFLWPVLCPEDWRLWTGPLTSLLSSFHFGFSLWDQRKEDSDIGYLSFASTKGLRSHQAVLFTKLPSPVLVIASPFTPAVLVVVMAVCYC